MTEIKQTYITAPGDLTVGIQEAYWTLDGDLIFEDREGLEAFREDLIKTFKNYTDDKVRVVFDFELEAIYKYERRINA